MSRRIEYVLKKQNLEKEKKLFINAMLSIEDLHLPDSIDLPIVKQLNTYLEFYNESIQDDIYELDKSIEIIKIALTSLVRIHTVFDLLYKEYE